MINFDYDITKEYTLRELIFARSNFREATESNYFARINFRGSKIPKKEKSFSHVENLF